MFVHFPYLFWQIQFALRLLMTKLLKKLGCSYVGQKSVIVVVDAVEDGLMHNDGTAGALDADFFIQALDLPLEHFPTILSKSLTACFIQAMVVVMSLRFLKRFVTSFALRLMRRFLVSLRVVTQTVN